MNIKKKKRKTTMKQRACAIIKYLVIKFQF